MSAFQDASVEAVLPKENPLTKIVELYSKSGMEILPIGHLHKPKTMKEMLHLEPDDFGVCAFMGSAPGKLPKIKELVRRVPEIIDELDSSYGIKMPLISGGGNWQGDVPGEKAGLMAEWAYGASIRDKLMRFVTTQGLACSEGLPHRRGIALCLKQEESDIDDARLGLRTDGLLYAGKFFIVFPGGLGTLVETLTSFTNLGIDEGFDKNKFLIVDPVVQTDSEIYRFFDIDMRSLKQKNETGFVSDRNAQKVNDHCIVYRPDASATVEQMAGEIVAITLATREAAPSYDPVSGYKPLPPTLLKQYSRPLFGQGSVGRVFDNFPFQDRSWGDSLGFLRTIHRNGHQLAL